jgi:acyl-CoA reductase-like NAD-dependent aldehyde dehydrogenase
VSEAEKIESINPATEESLATFQASSADEIEAVCARAADAFRTWRTVSFGERAQRMKGVAAYLRAHRLDLARLITAEMGKPINESEAEIEKCAWVCRYYAEHASAFLAAHPYPSSATESYVNFTPLGPVLAIMPWNFPFWQLMRFAAPALMAGNTGILKHASNVPQCALAAEEMFRASGFPVGVFQTLLLSAAQAQKLIEDPRVAAVTLTGSERAGSRVAEAAGRRIKKSVLELGGSDAFIVLEDADLDAAAETGVRARFQNTGQSCIAAKRFLVVDAVFQRFRERFVEKVCKLRPGDPTDRRTTIGPLARDDLRETLERQVRGSVADGAEVQVGGGRRRGRGYYFEPTVLTGVERGMSLVREEVFGPVAPLMRVRDAREAVELANDSSFGLGCSLWTRDLPHAYGLANEIEAGLVFVNGMVASDPRLPFGGVKRSGYGRELSDYGIREFVNIQSVWIGPQKE